MIIIIYLFITYYSFNRVCVVCISPSHKLFHTPNVNIDKIDYAIGQQLDRTTNKVSGKSKNKSIIIINDNINSIINITRWSEINS